MRPSTRSITVSSLGTASSSTASNVATIEFTGVPVEAGSGRSRSTGSCSCRCRTRRTRSTRCSPASGRRSRSTLAGYTAVPDSRPAATASGSLTRARRRSPATASVLLDTHETEGGADVTASGADGSIDLAAGTPGPTRPGRSRSTAPRTRVIARPASETATQVAAALRPACSRPAPTRRRRRARSSRSTAPTATAVAAGSPSRRSPPAAPATAAGVRRRRPRRRSRRRARSGR